MYPCVYFASYGNCKTRLPRLTHVKGEAARTYCTFLHTAPADVYDHTGKYLDINNTRQTTGHNGNRDKRTKTTKCDTADRAAVRVRTTTNG